MVKLAPPPPNGGGLLYVQQDTEYQLVKRRGRYAIEMDCAASPTHRDAAVQHAARLMVEGLAKLGFKHTGGAFELRSWEPHVDFSPDATPDLGQLAAPDPRDVAGTRRFAAAEKARAARKLGLAQEMIDFILVSEFVKPTGKKFRVHLAEDR